MLLTITTTHQPATDLGFLLVKNPARCQSFSLSFGQAHVFYPVAHDRVCTAALLVDLDPIRLVRRRSRQSQDRTLGQYVNDRPYVASSFLSVALARVYKSALGGQSKERPALAATAIPLEAQITAVQCRDGERMLRALFEPLGYTVSAERQPLDTAFPEWGASTYWSVTLRATHRLHDLLTHLYVLLPVLDDDKHYWVGEDELEKLLAKGEGWLSTHPERDLIVDRYLRYRRLLTREALARLVSEDDIDPDATEEAQAREEEVLEDRISLSEQRMMAVLAVLRGASATRVIDLGCGGGEAPPDAAHKDGLRADRRDGRVLSCPSIGKETLAARPAPSGATSTDHTLPGRAHLSGSATHRLRCRLCAGGYRASRTVAARRFRAGALRVCTAADRRDYHAERRVQRAIRESCRRSTPPRRPSLRVDPRGVLTMGKAGSRSFRL